MRTLEALIQDTEPFPEDVVKQLPPRGDNYVSWTHYAQRLLLHHRGYEWEPSDPVYADGTWAVRGVLTLDGERYGSVGEDTAPAAAESNAFKRACAHAGIGLHLYGDFWLHGRLARELSEAEAGF